MPLWSVTVDVYEPAGAGSSYPVVRHVFYGRTRAEAEGYLRAHLGADSFLRDCSAKGRYKDIACLARARVERLL